MNDTKGPGFRLVAELARHLDADLTLELWDGSLIPLRDGAREDMRIVIASESALRRLILAPSMSTVAELFAVGDLDVTGGTPIDTMRGVDHLQFRALPRKVDKARLLRAALPLLLKKPKAIGGDFIYAGSEREQFAPNRDDKELIHFHYDLSNAFYELMLDEQMVYSCGYFPTRDATLDEAQALKLDLICRKLRLAPGEKLFDPGCGWGGLICHAAQNYGVTAYGTTLSEEQFAYTTAKIHRLGLSDRVKIELRDCRDLPRGSIFDKVAQVEMIEHVGLRNHHEFYRHIRRHLRPRGLYFGQASARRVPANAAEFRKRSPYKKFFDRYVFPGGELDHVGMTVESLERAGFEVHDVEAMREHFALTCEHWVRNLHARREEAAALVGWPRTRIWLLYLSLCALSFERGSLCLYQVVASNRRAGLSGVPLDRSLLYP